jgi:hypothetical protein
VARYYCQLHNYLLSKLESLIGTMKNTREAIS